MEILLNPQSMLTMDLSKYDVIGFHATSARACASIEANGFLPDKIFGKSEHEKLIAIARSLEIDTSSHEEWLTMLSVTFTKSQNDALNHINQGSAGGQGLKNISGILEKISSLGDSNDAIYVRKLEEEIESIRSAGSVVYAVDLSNLGPRLDPDRNMPFYYFRWHPEKPLPLISEITPSRIIAKLVVTSGDTNAYDDANRTIEDRAPF